VLAGMTQQLAWNDVKCVCGCCCCVVIYFRQKTHRPKAIVAMDSFPKLLHMLGLAHDPLKVFAWARDYLIMMMKMMKMKLWTCYCGA
jgi:hypothetical protein